MNAAQLTPRALAVIADSGETGEPIFRTPCSVGSGEVVAQYAPTPFVAMAEKCGGRVISNLPLSGPCVAMSEGDLERFVYACGRAIALERAAIAAATEGAVS